MILLIGFSRVYLGVHYPTDVLGGFLLGGTALVVFINNLSRWDRWDAATSVSLKLLLHATMVIVLGGLLALFGPPGIPTIWWSTALALYVGLVLGQLLLSRLTNFHMAGSPLLRTLRLAVGLGPLLPVTIYFSHIPWIFCIGGLWLTAGAPVLFRALRLARA